MSQYALKEKSFPIRSFAYVLRILIPSFIWSAMFHGFFVCIEPLFFMLLEDRFRPRTIRVLRTLWCILFSISLLANWNILPLSYVFYFDVVLLGSPIKVMLSLACVLLLLGFYIFSGTADITSRKSRRFQLSAGLVMLILKLALVWSAPILSQLRHAIITPSELAGKVIEQSISSSSQSFSGPIAGPTFLNLVKRQSSLPPKVVLMVVESWGESARSLGQIEGGLQAHGIKIVESGFTTYQGSTLQGEFRELCSQNIRLHGDFLLSDMNSECAPGYFQRMGYRVLGMHGYKKDFYSRDLIWKKLGIQERYFDDSMKNLDRCNGPFTGVCDSDLIRHGTRLASGPERTFLYLLSLSSHEPLPTPLVAADTHYFTDIDTVTGTQVVARNAVASLVAALDTDRNGACTLAYIVGDHQPPSAVAGGMLDPQKVPFLALSFHCDAAKQALK
jgi:hypothetical protein